MNKKNTPKVESVLNSYNLNDIPEAHCYLKTGEHRIDLTFPDSESLQVNIFKELIISPLDVIDRKGEDSHVGAMDEAMYVITDQGNETKALAT